MIIPKITAEAIFRPTGDHVSRDDQFSLLFICCTAGVIPVPNICDEDFPVRDIGEGMPEVFRPKDFQEFSGRQPEPYKLPLLLIMSDLQVHGF